MHMFWDFDLLHLSHGLRLNINSSLLCSPAFHNSNPGHNDRVWGNSTKCWGIWPIPEIFGISDVFNQFLELLPHVWTGVYGNISASSLQYQLDLRKESKPNWRISAKFNHPSLYRRQLWAMPYVHPCGLGYRIYWKIWTEQHRGLPGWMGVWYVTAEVNAGHRGL